MSLENLVHEYESRLTKLKNWPDKSAIFELSSFALRNTQISNHIADILISKLIDPATNKNYKVPLFYLVDATMRNSGKQYINLFSSHIAVAFQRVFSEVHEIDKARLDYLLSTWEKRAQLPEHVLVDMRMAIGTRIVAEDVPRLPSQAGKDWTDGFERVAGISYGRGAVGNDTKNDGYLNANELRKEMEIELQQTYGVLGTQTKFTLDQLKTVNPQLFLQIEKVAMEKLEKKRKETRPYPTNSGKVDTGPLNPENFRNRMIGGFISEQSIIFDLGVSYDLTEKLRKWDPRKPSYAGTEYLKEASNYTATRLSEYLKNLDSPPPLPALIAGGNYSEEMLQQRIAEANRAEPKEKLPIPKFRHDQLGRPPKDALKALYVDRSFYCRQDGTRFKSQAELASHLDLLFIRNQDKQRKEGTRTYRQWYCKESQWITDFGSLKKLDVDRTSLSTSSTSTSSSTAITNLTNKIDGKSSDIPDEEMVLPADEYFTRCPVSNEAFLPEWDTEEGDYMYRNAVKVLLTEKADPQLYKVAQSTVYPLIRYIIVHQKLVMDGWLAAGKSASLYETIQKINKKYGAESEIGRILVSAYVHAAGEEEDSNDIFILLEPIERSNELSISDSIYQYEVMTKQQQQQSQQQQTSSTSSMNSQNVIESKETEINEQTAEGEGEGDSGGSGGNGDGEVNDDENGMAEMKMELQQDF